MTESKNQSTDEEQKKKKRKRGKKGKSGVSMNSRSDSQDQNFNQKLRELVKKYKGFDPWEKEHKALSEIEKKICKYLDNSGMEHKHRGRKYNIVLPDRKTYVFEPDIVIPHPMIRQKPILIQSVHPKNQDIIIPVLTEFKKQLGMKYFLVIVTKKDNLTNISPDVCDLLVAVEYASSLPSQIKSQSMTNG